MGQRGPAKKPTALRLLEGDRSHRTPNRSEPKPRIAADVPECPARLRGYARDEWERQAPDLHRIGLLTVADTALFERWCIAWQRGAIAYEAWTAEGFPPISDTFRAMDTADTTLLALSKRFGWSPSDRASIKTTEATDAEATRLDSPVRIGRTR